MKPNDDKKSICEACRSEFSCSADGVRCWCFEIEIAPPALLEIEKKYGACLCPACLGKFSSEFAAEDFTAREDSL